MDLCTYGLSDIVMLDEKNMSHFVSILDIVMKMVYNQNCQNRPPLMSRKVIFLDR